MNLVAQRAQFRVARRALGCQHAAPLRLDGLVVLDPEVECAPRKKDKARVRDRGQAEQQVERAELSAPSVFGLDREGRAQVGEEGTPEQDDEERLRESESLTPLPPT